MYYRKRYGKHSLDVQAASQTTAERSYTYVALYKARHDNPSKPSLTDQCRVCTLCSGDLKKLRDYLNKKPNVVLWNYLEDLALQKPDDSLEFSVLLQEKGAKEIETRRQFLQAKAIYEKQEIQKKKEEVQNQN